MFIYIQALSKILLFLSFAKISVIPRCDTHPQDSTLVTNRNTFILNRLHIYIASYMNAYLTRFRQDTSPDLPEEMHTHKLG